MTVPCAGDADYTINEDLRYSFAGKKATVSLATLADSKCEKNETFTVGILSKNESVVVRPESATATVVILDSSSACDRPTGENCKYQFPAIVILLQYS